MLQGMDLSILGMLWWVFGREGGVRKLALLDTDSKQLSPIATPYTEVSSVVRTKSWFMSNAFFANVIC